MDRFKLALAALTTLALTTIIVRLGRVTKDSEFSGGNFEFWIVVVLIQEGSDLFAPVCNA